MTEQQLSQTEIDLVVAIQEMLQKHSILSLEEINQNLTKQGFNISQKKINDILITLGAMRQEKEGHIIFRLPITTQS